MSPFQMSLLFGSLAVAGLVAGALVYRNSRSAAVGRRRRRKAAKRDHLRHFYAWVRQDPEIAHHLDELARHGLTPGSKGYSGPEPGEVAPDFRLRRLPGKGEGPGDRADAGTEEWVRLSDFAGHQPVVLIFGSYT